MAAIRGEVPDRLPFLPRLEFWHRAQQQSGTLPPELCSLSLIEIADRLGVGYYSIVPDYSECSGDGVADRGLGILQLPVLPYKVAVEGVERRVLSHDRETVVEYTTPAGTIRTASIFTDEMLAAGASEPWITEHAIREPRDFEVVGYIFSHLKVEPQFAGYQEHCERVGERGIVVGFASSWACPIHHIMAQLMGLEQFFYAMHDCPVGVERLCEQMDPFYQKVKTIAAESPAEVILLGSNYDDSITHPAFFKKYILPSLRGYAEVLHQKGKYLMTHTDGENEKLLPLYLEANFDIADSVCPHPMTRCRLEEIRKVFSDRITICGGIPSILLCSDSASSEEFRQFIDNLVERYEGQSHFIAGVSDMVTADADWERFLYIRDKIAKIV
jgi:hypothetical protein